MLIPMLQGFGQVDIVEIFFTPALFLFLAIGLTSGIARSALPSKKPPGWIMFTRAYLGMFWALGVYTASVSYSIRRPDDEGLHNWQIIILLFIGAVFADDALMALRKFVLKNAEKFGFEAKNGNGNEKDKSGT